MIDHPLDGVADRLRLWASEWDPPVDDRIVDAVADHLRAGSEPPPWFDGDHAEWAVTLATWVHNGWDASEADRWLHVAPFDDSSKIDSWFDSMGGIESWDARQWKDRGFTAQETMDWCYALSPHSPMVACDEWTADVCRWFSDGGVAPSEVLSAPDGLLDDMPEMSRMHSSGWTARDALAMWGSDHASHAPRTGKTHHLYPDYQWGNAGDVHQGDGMKFVSGADVDSTGEGDLSEPLVIESSERLPDGTVALTVVDRAAQTAQLIGQLGVSVQNDPSADIDAFERRIVTLPADRWVLIRR